VIWLVRFGDPTWRQQLQQWAQGFKFRATLAPLLDGEEERWHAAQLQQPGPVVTNHAVDDTLQTGDSRLLGGAMQIKAPWLNDDSTP